MKRIRISVPLIMIFLLSGIKYSEAQNFIPTPMKGHWMIMPFLQTGELFKEAFDILERAPLQAFESHFFHEIPGSHRQGYGL